jgi:hypothetical protein
MQNKILKIILNSILYLQTSLKLAKFCLERKVYWSIFETCVNINIHFLRITNSLNKVKNYNKFACKQIF